LELEALHTLPRLEANPRALLLRILRAQTGGTSSNAGTAPNYVNAQFETYPGGPKGKNLTEGGFESDDRKNASFNSEIGTKNDPGRLAEHKMQGENADAAGDAAMPRQKGMTGDNEYAILGGDIPV
jgi:hypothetical protein